MGFIVLHNKKMAGKTKLGQFYTTNFQYILQNMYIPHGITNIIEPFVGNGDLLQFIADKSKYEIEIYDIDPKIDYTIQENTLLNPPNYDNKFVITNPPYLARNKNTNKEIYDKWNCNDLYKCFILHLINSNCSGGIIIIPLNFITSVRKTDLELRQKFIEKFHIQSINIFEEQVFDDTTYTVCTLQFTPSTGDSEPTNIYIYPSKTTLTTCFNRENNFTVGGEIHNLPNNPSVKIERATRLTKNKDNITNILLKCIDDNIDKQLGLSIDEQYIDNSEKLSARSYATLVITPKLNEKEQDELATKFNAFIRDKRKEYNSLFLTNYRESNSIARKRISFDLAFKICNYLLAS
jgi:hypothetical protein